MTKLMRENENIWDACTNWIIRVCTSPHNNYITPQLLKHINWNGMVEEEEVLNNVQTNENSYLIQATCLR